jgi:hypothetical protein
VRMARLIAAAQAQGREAAHEMGREVDGQAGG